MLNIVRSQDILYPTCSTGSFLAVCLNNENVPLLEVQSQISSYTVINYLPEGYKGNYGIIPCLYIRSLQSTTCRIVQILHHFTVTVNNIEVTVNTCTCTDVFTVI